MKMNRVASNNLNILRYNYNTVHFLKNVATQSTGINTQAIKCLWSI